MPISPARRRAPLLVLLGALAGAAGCDSTSPEPRVAELRPVSGSAQRDTVRATLATPLVVQALASGGNGIRGQELLFRAGSGGTVTPATAKTDDKGRAQVTWTLGSRSGAQTLTVLLARDTTVTATFTATADAGALAGVEVAQGSGQVGTAAKALPQPVVFRAYDSYGNDRPGAALALTVMRGGGTLAASSATTGADGRMGATWTLGTQSVDQRVAAIATLPATNTGSVGNVGSVTAFATASVDTTRTLFLSLPDSAAVGDTVNAEVHVNLTGLGGTRRGLLSATLNWTGATLRVVSIPIRDSREQGTSYIPAVGAAPVTVLVSRPRNDLPNEVAFTVRFVVQARAFPSTDVAMSLTPLSLLGAGTFDDLLGSVSVVGDVIRIR
ncbi:MAG: hypothetical protein JO040_08440 [Gemmatimonadetes bacterium]|nr:hypothetical protein [Gemmatimonadota bacterium]